MPLRVAFHTLGCKLNQLETESFADAFARSGAEVVSLEGEEGSAAALVVVNTCTVTSKAEQKARRILRSALAADPAAVVLITGCYAEVEAASLSTLDERALVLRGSRKAELLGLPSILGAAGLIGADAGGDGLLREMRSWLEGLEAEPRALGRTGAAGPAGAASVEARDGRFAYEPESFAFHSRPSLKIEDGCDNECAYCRVHIARGAAVSLGASEVLRRARALEEQGAAEIVLAGVNLAQYRDGERDFPALLKLLVAGTERVAFRISSYEPDRIDERFTEAFALERVRPHVHFALQSGSDRVLAAMRRHYGRDQVLAAIEALKRARPDPFLAADMIAGFPGETEEDARASLELARDCGFAWIHAFRFSPRPGTEAAAMRGRVPERLAQERAEALLELGRRGRAAYIERSIGREVEAILESDLRATSENYLKLRVAGLPSSAKPGEALRCRIEASSLSYNNNQEIDAEASYIYSSIFVEP